MLTRNEHDGPRLLAELGVLFEKRAYLIGYIAALRDARIALDLLRRQAMPCGLKSRSPKKSSLR